MLKTIVFLGLFISFNVSKLLSDANKPIEILLTSDNSIYEQALFGIQTSINREIHVNYLDIILAEYDSPATYFQELENKGIPLIITIGKGATRIAEENTHKIPIVFSMVSFESLHASPFLLKISISELIISEIRLSIVL